MAGPTTSAWFALRKLRPTHVLRFCRHPRVWNAEILRICRHSQVPATANVSLLGEPRILCVSSRSMEVPNDQGQAFPHHPSCR
jgi:hypothetical protein